MQILIDTRETKPLKFYKKWHAVEGTERYYLNKQGDYAVRFNDGHIPPIRVERKQNHELYGNLTTGMTRFKAEINNCAKLGLMLYIFIEGTLQQFLEGNTYSDARPDSLIRTLNTLEVKYHVVHKFYPTRGEMARAIYELFYAEGKQYDKRKPNKTRVTR